jgi:large conductance mechanosensitive channel
MRVVAARRGVTRRLLNAFSVLPDGPSGGEQCLPRELGLSSFLITTTGGVPVFKEFREFIARGNVLDLAVAVIIGAAFGAVVNSLVNDVVMPPIGALLGKVDFGSLFLNLSGQAYPSLKAAKDAGAPVIGYGSFLNTIINFLVIAFVVFQVVRTANRFKRPEAAAPVSTKECPYCAMSIPIKAKRCPLCTSQL